MLNPLYFTRSGAVVIEGTNLPNNPATKQQLATVVTEMFNYGYIPSQKLYEVLENSSIDILAALLNEILPEMKEAVGSGQNVTPMYPNFPQQVIEASDADLFINALLHYLGDVIGYRILPKTKIKNRSFRFDFPEAKVIDLGTPEGALHSLAMFLTMPISWGINERRLLNSLLKAPSSDILKTVNENMSLMPNRENRAEIFAALSRIKNELSKNGTPNKENIALSEYITQIINSSLDIYNTATDALRIAAAWSGFSPALSSIKHMDEETTRIRFSNMPNSLSKNLLTIINRDKDVLMNLSRRPGLFKSLGEKIHPGRYLLEFPRAAEGFNKIRQNEYLKPEADLQKMFTDSNLKGVVAELLFSPGVFTRKLNQVLMLAEKNEAVSYVVSEYNTISASVPSKLLWQAYKFFDDYFTKEVRASITKGSSAQYYVFAENQSLLKADTVNQAKEALYEAILNSYAMKGTLSDKKIFVDPGLSGVAVPSTLRDSTNLQYSAGRGSRLPIPEVNSEAVDTIRLFMHWSDIVGSRVDLDLSAEAYNGEYKLLGSVWYGNLRDNFATHSGDITSAPNGAAEYIDIDVKRATERGIRYIVASVTSFSGQPLNTIPEAYAGCMAISGDAQVGEIFDAKNVVSKFQLNSSSRKVLTVVLDIEKREMILADVSPMVRAARKNVISTVGLTSQALKALISQSIINVSDVVKANVLARKGTLVDNKDDADLSFEYNSNGLSVPLDEILSKWL